MVRPIEGPGTPESDWQAWGGLADLPALDLAELGAAPLVVAPHPDDEILGAGGLLAIAGGEVAAVTGGEASHPGSSALSPAALAELRHAETRAALAALGRPATRVHPLGHPDGDIDEDLLADQLSALLSAPPARACVVSWRGDGHPDHEAAGRAAARACAATGARLVEYPVWLWHWARPADAAAPWASAVRLPLSARVQARKRAAVAAFVSQTRPLGPGPADAAILPPHVLARFDRVEEVFFR